MVGRPATGVEKTDGTQFRLLKDDRSEALELKTVEFEMDFASLMDDAFCGECTFQTGDY